MLPELYTRGVAARRSRVVRERSDPDSSDPLMSDVSSERVNGLALRCSLPFTHYEFTALGMALAF